MPETTITDADRNAAGVITNSIVGGLGGAPQYQRERLLKLTAEVIAESRTPSDHETVLRREATIIGVDPELPARELLEAIIAWHDGHDPGDE